VERLGILLGVFVVLTQRRRNKRRNNMIEIVKEPRKPKEVFTDVRALPMGLCVVDWVNGKSYLVLTRPIDGTTCINIDGLSSGHWIKNGSYVKKVYRIKEVIVEEI
jgi:hypothetical protein